MISEPQISLPDNSAAHIRSPNTGTSVYRHNNSRYLEHALTNGYGTPRAIPLPWISFSVVLLALWCIGRASFPECAQISSVCKL